jgi:hypothetical protein
MHETNVMLDPTRNTDRHENNEYTEEDVRARTPLQPELYALERGRTCSSCFHTFDRPPRPLLWVLVSMVPSITIINLSAQVWESLHVAWRGRLMAILTSDTEIRAVTLLITSKQRRHHLDTTCLRPFDFAWRHENSCAAQQHTIDADILHSPLQSSPFIPRRTPIHIVNFI